MDKSLFNKVFNNIFLFKKIINYVQYKDWEFNYNNNNVDNDNTYEIILKSKNLYEITLSNLIKNKQYNLFNKLFDFYINKYKDNQQEFNQQEDLYEIIKFKELGINRFKIIFQLYNINEIDKLKLLKSIFSSGNIEILKFIKEYYNDENYFENVKAYGRLSGSNDLWSDNEYYDFFNIVNFAENDIISGVLDCGNNLEIFKEIYFKRMNQTFSLKHLKMIYNFTKIGYNNLYSFLIDEYILKINATKPTKSQLILNHYYELIKISIDLENLELGNCILLKLKKEQDESINEILNNLNKKLIFQYSNGFYGGLKFSDKSFNVFKLYLTNELGNLFIKLQDLGEFKIKITLNPPSDKLSKIYYYQFKFWEIKNQDDIKSILKFKDIDKNSNLFIQNYIPNTIEEYKEIFKIIDNEGDDDDDDSISNLFIENQSKGITIIQHLLRNPNFNFEFLKFIIEILIEKSKITIDLLLKYCLNCNFEICNYYLNKYQDFQMNATSFHFEINQLFSNSFNNGNLEFFKFIEQSRFSIVIPNFYNLSIESCIKNGNLNIIKYILDTNNLKGNNVVPLLIFLKLTNNFNRFQIFKYLIDYYVNNLKLNQFIINNYSIISIFKSKFIHYLLNENLIYIYNLLNKSLLLYNDFHLFKLFTIKFPNLIKLNLFKFLINCNNFKILNYLIENILNQYDDQDDDFNLYYSKKDKQNLILNLILKNDIKKLKLLISIASNFILKQFYKTIIINTININGNSNLNLYKTIKCLFETIENREKNNGSGSGSGVVLSIKEVYIEYIFNLVILKNKQKRNNNNNNKPIFNLENFKFLKNYNNNLLNNSNDLYKFMKSKKTKELFNENLKLFTNLELELIGISNYNYNIDDVLLKENNEEDNIMDDYYLNLYKQ